MRVLAALADEHSIDLGLRDVATVRDEMARLGCWAGPRLAAPNVDAEPAAKPDVGQAVLGSWRMLLDSGRMQDGEPHLAATARPTVVRLSATTATDIAAADADNVTVSTERGRITLPLKITEMPDGVVWLPLNSPGSAVHGTLGVSQGDVVSISKTGGTP
jgi:NADH-quinone oxidoreductase subunit G